MNDYISREAVLSKCTDIWDNADETTQTGVDTINTIDKITDFIESLPAADVQPVDKWIRVKNKFPNDRERVIVCTVDGRVFEMKFDKRRECWGRLGNDGMLWYSKYFVTYWMPLPEPPKDGDTE